MEKLINVITRTSNRPKGFDRNYHSIKNQTYKNINHIVIYDNPDDYTNYVSKYDGITIYGVDRQKLIDEYNGPIFYNKLFWPSYHNLYFNPVLQTINEGWVIFLDDDDYFKDENSVMKISEYLTDVDTIYIWKMLTSGNLVIPRPLSFLTKKIKVGDIGSNCFTFHSKWAKSSQWDGYKCGDFRFLESLSKIIPKTTWIDDIFVVVPSSGFGKKIDI